MVLGWSGTSELKANSCMGMQYWSKLNQLNLFFFFKLLLLLFGGGGGKNRALSGAVKRFPVSLERMCHFECLRCKRF